MSRVRHLSALSRYLNLGRQACGESFLVSLCVALTL